MLFTLVWHTQAKAGEWSFKNYRVKTKTCILWSGCDTVLSIAIVWRCRAMLASIFGSMTMTVDEYDPNDHSVSMLIASDGD